jgi:nucleotide-binding universal stress UspA family protein
VAGTIQTVLIGTSLDESSDAVVRVGVEVARAVGAQVHLVHAFTPPVGYGTEWGLDFGIDEFLRTEEERLRAALAAQAERLGAGAWSLESGVAHRVLSKVAERLEAGLVVVGASEGRMARLLGSTADRVIRKSRRPVLMVRGEPPVPFARALAPVDLSPLSAEAFRRGLGLLAAVGGGEPPLVEALFVLTVLQRQVAPQFTPEQIDRFAVEELERFVAANAGEAAERVVRKVRTGNVREEILAEIEEWRPDLVFLGTHGIGGFDRLVIGSVAADVMREAPCSVLVIPPAETEDR